MKKTLLIIIFVATIIMTGDLSVTLGQSEICGTSTCKLLPSEEQLALCRKIEEFQKEIVVLKERIKKLETQNKRNNEEIGNLREMLLTFFSTSISFTDKQMDKLKEWWGKSEWGQKFFVDLKKKMEEKEKKRE